MQFNHDSLHIISTSKYYITCMHALIILHLNEYREVNLIPIFQKHPFNHDYLLRLYREKYSEHFQGNIIKNKKSTYLRSIKL